MSIVEMEKPSQTTVGTKSPLKFEVSDEAKLAIIKGIERGDCIVEMELLEVPQRIINALENSKFNIVTLENLMNCRLEDLMTISNIGVKAIEQIYNSLARYHELEMNFDI